MQTYKLSLYWNAQGEKPAHVLEATCTAVCAYDVAYTHVDQFAGKTHSDWLAHAFHGHRSPFSLTAIMALEAGKTLSGGYEDSTGHAQFVIERI